MLGFHPNLTRSTHSCVNRWRTVLVVAVLLVPICNAIAQQSAPRAAWSSYRVSVASKAARGCQNAVPPGIKEDAEARLRGMGIAVSDVFNAQLSIDLDCVAMSQTGVAGSECLVFSEMVSVPTTGSRSLAATWRSCRAFTCNRANCAAARTGIQGLLDEFASELSERNAQASQILTISESAPAPQPVNRRLAILVFYSLYIIACITVMLYWRMKRQAYR